MYLAFIATSVFLRIFSQSCRWQLPCSAAAACISAETGRCEVDDVIAVSGADVTGDVIEAELLSRAVTSATDGRPLCNQRYSCTSRRRNTTTHRHLHCYTRYRYYDQTWKWVNGSWLTKDDLFHFHLWLRLVLSRTDRRSWTELTSFSFWRTDQWASNAEMHCSKHRLTPSVTYVTTLTYASTNNQWPRPACPFG